MIDKESFGKRLDECLKSRKITNTEITKALKLNKNAIGNYKSGQIPNTNILYDISNFLGISIDYLLTGKESGELTEEEQKLINTFRRCNLEGQKEIQNFAKFTETDKPNKTDRAEEHETQISTSKIG